MERPLIVGVLALLIAIGAVILGLATWSKVSTVERDIPHKIDQLNTSLGAKIDSLNRTLIDRLVSLNKTISDVATRVARLEKKAKAEKEIVIVPIDTPLFDFSVDFLITYVKKLRFDNNTAGVVLLINSPGGAVGATERLYTTIRGLNKTVYAVIAGLGASGAYYTAVAAQRIYATPSSWVGSIGVIAFLWPDEYLYDLPDYIYTTGPYKYYGMDLTEFYNDIEKVRANFVATVLRGRGARLKAAPEVFETARIFSADRALELGLIDKIGGLWEAVEDMAKELGLENYTVVDIYEKYNITRRGIVIIPLVSGGKIPLEMLLNES
ncbi:MAG: S49 family peptidase, partial [Pyrobaculum sp.]